MDRRSTAPVPPAAAQPSPWSALLWGALVLASVFIVYLPALSGTPLWDDDGHLTARVLRSFSGLSRIWLEPGITQQYYPLLHSAFWFEARLWGDACAGYHLANVIEHATAAVLFAVLLRRLQVPGAWFAALLFALHPVCVESVAWISEQKNTLSLVLYLAAALAWLRFEEERRPGRYALATALFIAALLTKSVTATLPAALLVIAWWRRGTLRAGADVVPLLPWFALAITMGLLTAHFEHTMIGAQGADFALGPVERVLLAGRAFWFYLGKLALPVELSFIYPRWHLDASAVWQYCFPVAALGLAAFLVWRRRRRRGPLAVFLLFAGTLAPALGFFDVFPFVFSYVADHFQYHASLAVFAAAAAGLASLLGRADARWRLGVLGLLLGALGFLSWRQSAEYRDHYSLYGATLERNPDCWMAHHNLGVVLVNAGRPAEAIVHYQRALALRANYVEAYTNLGFALTQLGRVDEARAALEQALRLKPDYAEAHNNLGNVCLAQQQPDAALAHFAEAVRLNPHYLYARLNFGMALAGAGRLAEAAGQFAAAARLDPEFADPQMHWAVALTQLGRFTEAEPHFLKAMELQPDSPRVHAAYASALASVGRQGDAEREMRAAEELSRGN